MTVRTASGAPSVPVRPARRTQYPDGSPGNLFGRPGLKLQPEAERRLTLRVRGDTYTVTPVTREPGDETVQILALHRLDGTRFECVEYEDCHTCTCPEFGIDFDPGYCAHLRELVRRGVFARLGQWSTGGQEGGRR